MTALGALDLALISIFVSLSGGLESSYFILYYLALGMFVVVATCPWLSFLATSAVAAVYSGLSFYLGPGIDLSSQGEKVLVIRILALYGIVTLVHLIVGFERMKSLSELRHERDRALHRQRVELSQVIHDTTAQSAYMIGLGLETAIELAAKSNQNLTESLEATYALTKSTLWELRHPIDIGLIFEGRELANVLQAHAGTFTSITSVPAQVTVNGKEPPLSPSTRSGLFSIAHNAMTNSYRHASPTRVDISLDFEPNLIRISVSDDGTGLPSDYADRGHGFGNMGNIAESIGGRLEIETGGADGGTVVSCLIPYETNPGG